MKKIFFASATFLTGAYFLQGLWNNGEVQTGTLAKNVREGPVVARSIASSQDQKRVIDEAYQRKLKQEILELENEVERYSRYLDYLYSAHFEEEKSRPDFRLNEGGDSELSKQDQEIIEDHIKQMQEKDELREKYKNETPTEETTEVDFYEQLIREKQDRIGDLERLLK